MIFQNGVTVTERMKKNLERKSVISGIFLAMSMVFVSASATLWVRSYGESDFIMLPRSGMTTRYALGSYLGRFVITRLAEDRPIFDPACWKTYPIGSVAREDIQRGDGPWVWAGFGGWQEPISDGTKTFYLKYFFWPYWFSTLLMAIFPLFCLRNWWKTRTRRRNKLCDNCGYDLRSSPGSCPECGAPKEI